MNNKKNQEFTSYGFLGKHHSKETKQILSQKLKLIAKEKGFGKWMKGKISVRKGIKLTIEERKLISEGTKKGMKNSYVMQKVNEANKRNRYDRARKAEKCTVIRHHKNLNILDNSESNILILGSRNIHRSLHARAYDYVVELNIYEEYIKWFQKKYL